MKNEKIVDAIGLIDDEYIKEAHEKRLIKKSFNWGLVGKLAVAAVCLCLVVTIVPNMFNSFSKNASGGDSYYIERSNNYSSGGSYEVAEDMAIPSNASYETKSNTVDLKQDKKLIVTGNLNIETMDLDELLAKLNESINKYGAYIQDSSINTSGYRRVYDAAIRIPAENYEDFLTGVKDNGNVTYYHENTKDITDTYTDLNAKLTSLKAQEDRVLEFYKEAKTLDELLAVEERLSEIRYEIDYIENQLKNYDLQVAYSTLYITVYETKEYTETSESFWTRLGNSFSNGWTNFTGNVGDFILDIVYNIWTIIILILVGFGGYKLYKHIRNKRNK